MGFVVVTDLLPEPLAELFRDLRDRGYEEASAERRRSERKGLVRLVRGNGAVRVSRRGAEWILELNYPLWGSGWVDAAVVRAALDHTSAAGPDDLVALSNFVRAEIDGRLAKLTMDETLQADLDRLDGLRRTAERGLTP